MPQRRWPADRERCAVLPRPADQPTDVLQVAAPLPCTRDWTGSQERSRRPTVVPRARPQQRSRKRCCVSANSCSSRALIMGRSRSCGRCSAMSMAGAVALDGVADLDPPRPDRGRSPRSDRSRRPNGSASPGPTSAGNPTGPNGAWSTAPAVAIAGSLDDHSRYLPGLQRRRRAGHRASWCGR